MYSPTKMIVIGHIGAKRPILASLYKYSYSLHILCYIFL